jgi:hypothetical protein
MTSPDRNPTLTDSERLARRAAARIEHRRARSIHAQIARREQEARSRGIMFLDPAALARWRA